MKLSSMFSVRKSFLMVFLFVLMMVVNSIPALAVSCSYSSLSIFKPQIFTDDLDIQEANLTFTCSNPADVNQLNDIRILVNQVNNATEPYRGYFRWTPAGGFVEYGGTTYNNQHVTLLSSSRKEVNATNNSIVKFVYRWTMSPSYGAIVDNDISYYWKENTTVHNFVTVQTNFESILVASVYPSLNSITVEQPHIVADGTQVQTAYVRIDLGVYNNINDLQLIINKVNTPSQPWRGRFQWLASSGFAELGGYGNQFVELLPNQSTFEDLGGQYLYTFNWKLLSTYGNVSDNDISYWWNEPGNGRIVGWNLVQTNFTVEAAANWTPTVPTPPTSPAIIPYDQKAELRWLVPSYDGGSVVTDYIIEYAEYGQPYNVFSDGVNATNMRVNVTGLTNGVTYQFRVKAVNSVGEGNASAALYAIPHAPLPEDNLIRHILSTGQSLSVGYNGEPALNIAQPYENLRLIWTSGDPFRPLVEIGVETMSSAMANTMTFLVPDHDYRTLVTRHGVSGYSYAQLKKGTGPYNTGMNQVWNASKDAAAEGKNYTVIAVTTIHGETDHVLGNAPYYESYLVEWQNDYETDVQAITGQTTPIPMFTDQMGSWTRVGPNATSEIEIAQLAAAEHNPTKIYLVGPKYQLPYSDRIHLNNYGYRWLGEYYGKVMKKVLIENQSWMPLSPLNVTRTGSVITVQFHVPEQPIVLDTALVPWTEHYGFEYFENVSPMANITSVNITSSDTIQITLNQTPSGINEKLRYAYTGIPSRSTNSTGYARGNIRDSDATSSLYNNTQYNWLVHFDKPITVIS